MKMLIVYVFVDLKYGQSYAIKYGGIYTCLYVIGKWSW